MNAKLARAAAALAGAALTATLAVGQASGAAHPGVLPGAVHGPVLQVSPAPAHTGAGMAELPLAVQIHGHTAAGRAVFGASAPTGYTPAQLAAYLSLHGNGAGQTVAIVDAFRDPTITSDVNAFSQQFGLPQTCGSSGAGSTCFALKVKAPNGTEGTDPGWGLETALDVETVHAIAPQATIVLEEARTSSLGDMWRAIDHAAALRPDVISNSWTLNATEFTGETAYDAHCRLAHSLCVFSSGDHSNPAGYPSTNPYVLAVGGTTLSLTSAGAVTSETAWGCVVCPAGSGGGLSYIEPRPAYQRPVNHAPYRGVPDVSFDADPATGFSVYDSDGIPAQWFQVGGTSFGAPAWSAILAVADGLRAAAGKGPLAAAGYQAQKAIYGLKSGLADITQGVTGPLTGSSDWTGVPCGVQCVARTGYDTVTGLGSPRPGIDTALAAAR